MTPDTDQFDDRNIIARTAYGEARSEGHDGMQAVINSGQNRLASGETWWGTSLRSIFLFPKQYSAWNLGDPNRPIIMEAQINDPIFTTALGMAGAALAANLPDLVHGATNYFNPFVVEFPDWAAGKVPTAIVGNHWFYRLV